MLPAAAGPVGCGAGFGDLVPAEGTPTRNVAFLYGPDPAKGVSLFLALAEPRPHARPSRRTVMGTGPLPLVPTSRSRFSGCTERSAIGEFASAST
jgi:hypothetical protein